MSDLDAKVDLSHHAYCLIGAGERRHELVKSLNHAHDIEIKGNPDLYERKYTVFTIADARELKQQAESKPITSAGRKIFILEMSGITVEAQNALLKLLEEPADRTHFFIIIPSAHLLLPTIKSRILLIDGGGESDFGRAAIDAGDKSKEDLSKLAQKLMSARMNDRFDIVKSFMDEITKEKRPKQDAVELLGLLEEMVYKRGMKGGVDPIESVILARKYATDRAPSMKMLLEYVSMNI